MHFGCYRLYRAQHVSCCVSSVQMRVTIKAVFPDRDVAVMVRPALTEADLQRLNQLPNASLRPEFKKVCRARMTVAT